MVGLRILSALWQAPVAAIVWLLYLLPFWGLGWHVRMPYEGGGRWVVLFRTSLSAPRWHRGLWRKWGGHSMPFAVVLKGERAITGRYAHLLAHEFRHVDQWAVLGVLFPVVYLVLLPFFGYQNHPLERDAEVHSR